MFRNENGKILIIACPICGRWKQFGRFEHINITISKLLRALAYKGVREIKIIYERCNKCSGKYDSSNFS